MPGAPELFWGEEQSFSLMDSTSPDYLYGRQPMSSNMGWHAHGCYSAGYETYVDLPLGPALEGCHDETNGLDNSEFSLVTCHLVSFVLGTCGCTAARKVDSCGLEDC